MIEQPNDGLKLEEDKDFNTVDVKINESLESHMLKLQKEFT